jgi:hypothetical protein
MAAAQEEGMVVPTLDVFHTIISWPSFNEGAVICTVLWCFRNVERVLGSKTFLVFLAYNLILYFPVFCTVVYFKGFALHYSLFYFVPYSLYAYAAWHIPSSTLVSVLSDKLLISLMLLIDLVVAFPYGFGPLLTGIAGTILWRIDLLKLKKWCERTESQANNMVETQPLEAEPEIDGARVQAIVEMGFSEAQATEALRAADGDLQRAIETLIGGMS